MTNQKILFITDIHQNIEFVRSLNFDSYDMILYRHFHELYGKINLNDIIIFNPGAIKDNKYGVIEISDNNLKFEFKNI